MIVGYTPLKTVVEDMGSRIPDGENPIRSHFNEERNADMTCLHETNAIDNDMFRLSEHKEYCVEIDTVH
jgi:hypothetical protein